jgi:hypothetical protein
MRKTEARESSQEKTVSTTGTKREEARGNATRAVTENEKMTTATTTATNRNKKKKKK